MHESYTKSNRWNRFDLPDTMIVKIGIHKRVTLPDRFYNDFIGERTIKISRDQYVALIDKIRSLPHVTYHVNYIYKMTYLDLLFWN